MFIDLIDLLRCTRPHEDSWLVAAFREVRKRHVFDGLLSCPVCKAHYPIKKGVAYFDVAVGVEPGPPPAGADSDRIAAYLNLIEPGVVLLGGEWAASAGGIADMGSTVIAVNAAQSDPPYASHIRCADVLPIAAESLDGVALGADLAGLTALAARGVKNGARIVAPVSAPVPDGMNVLARDARFWVGVRAGGGASAPVQIARR